MTPYLSAMTVTVTMTKSAWGNPNYELVIDDEGMSMSCQASRRLTQTYNEDGQGIFNAESDSVKFKRGDTWVAVDFGALWAIEEYENPALEITRRASLVDNAFAEIADARKETWTVSLY
jgi:hypothetical protein